MIYPLLNAVGIVTESSVVHLDVKSSRQATVQVSNSGFTTYNLEVYGRISDRMPWISVGAVTQATTGEVKACDQYPQMKVDLDAVSGIGTITVDMHADRRSTL